MKRKGGVLVMRAAALPGLGGRRRVLVAYRARTLKEALGWAACHRRGGLWVALLGAAAHRRQGGRASRREALRQANERAARQGAEGRRMLAQMAGAPGARRQPFLLEMVSGAEVKSAGPAQDAGPGDFLKCL